MRRERGLSFTATLGGKASGELSSCDVLPPLVLVNMFLTLLSPLFTLYSRKVREATLEAIESGQIGTGHGLAEEDLPANRSEDPYQYIRQSVPPQQRVRKRLRSRRSYTDDEPSPTRPLDIAELEGAKPRRPPEEASKA